MKKLLKIQTHVWLAGFINIFGYMNLLYVVIEASNHEAVSLMQLISTAYIQITYMLLGKITKNKALFACMLISLILNAGIILYVAFLRWFP